MLSEVVEVEHAGHSRFSAVGVSTLDGRYMFGVECCGGKKFLPNRKNTSGSSRHQSLSWRS